MTNIKYEGPPFPATLIAQYFIDKGKETGDVTPMKLQKLVYFAHGIYMATHEGKPLIKEYVEAWEHGPVIPSLYYQFKWFGSKPILRDQDESAWIFSDMKGYRHNIRRIPPEIREFLSDIWHSFGHLTASQLRQLTHKKGSPWSKYYQTDDAKTGKDIPDNEICNYFSLEPQTDV